MMLGRTQEQIDEENAVSPEVVQSWMYTYF
jgi:hypothetical protein